MSDFSGPWTLSRTRFIEGFSGLNQEQIHWRLHPGTLTIAEMVLHVAGVEILFASQLNDQPTEGMATRLRAAATEGVVNDNPFPFSPEQVSPAILIEAMEISRSWIEPLLAEATPEIRAKSLVSALGPIITGEGAFARLSFHAAYHQGQIHLLTTAPGFPA